MYNKQQQKEIQFLTFQNFMSIKQIDVLPSKKSKNQILQKTTVYQTLTNSHIASLRTHNDIMRKVM